MSTPAMKRLLQFWRSRRPVGSDRFPPIHHFPNIGPDGQVTIDCIIRASSGAYRNDPQFRQNPDGRPLRIPPHRVGIVVVELDQYGLCLRWEPDEKIPKFGLSGATLNSPPPPFNNGPKAEADPNARLIAASPELLAIAKRVAVLGNDPLGISVFDLAGIVADAKEAVAKAEGRA